jgi:hypothetical protein
MSLSSVSVISNALRLRFEISRVSIYGVFTPLFAASKRDIFWINIV